MTALVQAFGLLDGWIWLLLGFVIGLAVWWAADTLFFRKKLLQAKLKTEAQLDECQAELSRARLNVERVQVQSNARAGEFNAAVQARNSLQTALNARERQVASLSAQLQQARTDFVKLHRTQIALEKKLNEAYRQLKYLQTNLEGAQNERSALFAHLNNYQEDAASMADMIRELQRDREKLIAEAAQLRPRAEAHRTAPPDLAPLHTARDFDGTSAPGRNSNEPTHGQPGEIETLHAQWTTLRAEHDAAQQGRAAIEKQLESLRAQHASTLRELAEWRTRFGALDQAHRQATAERDNLAQQLPASPPPAEAQATSRATAVDEEKRSLAAQLQQARLELDAARASRAALEIEYDKSKKRLSDLQAEVDQSAARHEQVRNQLAQLQTHHETLIAHRARLEQELHDLEQRHDGMQSERDALADQNQSLEQELANVRAQSETATQDLDAVRAARELLDLELGQMRGQFAELEQAYATVISARNSLLEQLDRARQIQQERDPLAAQLAGTS